MDAQIRHLPDRSLALDLHEARRALRLNGVHIVRRQLRSGCRGFFVRAHCAYLVLAIGLPASERLAIKAATLVKFANSCHFKWF
jgi:hypothetical protein